MLNVNVKELLKEEKNTLRVLNGCFGFDFQKEFTVYKHVGKFTINSLLKNTGLDTNNYKIVLLVKPGYFLPSNYYNMVELMENNKINVDCKPWKSGIYNNKISYFVSKTYFENARKEDKTITFIVAQNKNNMQLVTHNNNNIDLNNKFKVVKVNQCYYSKSDKHYINKIVLYDTVKHKKIEYKPITETNNINLIVDKSGFIVERVKHQLKNKATQLKNERLKNEFLTVDYTNNLTEVKTLTDRLKMQLSNKLLNSGCNYEFLKDYEKTMFKFKWLMFDVEKYTNNIINKKYSSVAAAQKAYTDILNKFNELLEV